MKMVQIRYDDREKFPWIVFVGSIIWNKCRTLQGAKHNKNKLEKLLKYVQEE